MVSSHVLVCDLQMASVQLTLVDSLVPLAAYFICWTYIYSLKIAAMGLFQQKWAEKEHKKKHTF